MEIIASRMRHNSLMFALSLCLTAGTSSVVRAQTAPPAIPTALASALIDDRMSPMRSPPSFTVGALPPGYPASLVPRGPVSIVGGMTTSDGAVAVFADSTRRLAAVFEELFGQAGYVRPPATPASGFSSAYGPYSSFCGDSGTVSVEPLAGSLRTFARVAFRPSRGRPCAGYQPTRSPTQLALPALAPPTGVHVSRSGGGSGDDGVESNAEMTGTNLVPAIIVAHYASQLTTAGWTAEAPAVSDRVAAQYFEARDSSGGAWEGTLIASGNGSTLKISLTMHSRDNR